MVNRRKIGMPTRRLGELGMILKAAHWFCVNVSFQTAGPFPGTVKLREGSLKLY